MVHAQQFCLPLLLLLLFTLTGQILAQDEEPISVGADVTAIEVGNSGEIGCTTTTTEALQWFVGTNNSMDNMVPDNSSLRIYANSSTGLLTIREAFLNDTGVYLCQTSSGNHSVSTELHVYEMPTYFESGMIVLGINAALILLLVGCSIHTCVQKKKKAKADRKKLQKKTTINV